MKLVSDMTADELSDYAVALATWEWVSGMMMFRPPSGAPDDGGDKWRYLLSPWHPGEEWRPDFSDPATLGCALSVARKVLQEPTLHVVPYHTHVSGPPPTRGMVQATWFAMAVEPFEYIHSGPASVLINRQGRYMAGPTEAHAIVSAIASGTFLLEEK